MQLVSSIFLKLVVVWQSVLFIKTSFPGPLESWSFQGMQIGNNLF